MMERHSKMKVVEAFLSFIKVGDSSAIGLHKLITNSIQQKGLNIKNRHKQGYDGAAVTSGSTPACIRRSNMWVHMLTTCIVLRII